MLIESAYRLLLDVLREPARFLDPRYQQLVSEESVSVDLFIAPSRPSSPLIRRQVELTPFDLVRIWRDRQPDIQSFSLLVGDERETKRACVSRCPDGTIQEAYCSDTAADILNCTELTTLRCGTSGAARTDFIGLPRGLGTITQSRVPRPEPA
jgi:hypothetical protein